MSQRGVHAEKQWEIAVRSRQTVEGSYGVPTRGWASNSAPVFCHTFCRVSQHTDLEAALPAKLKQPPTMDLLKPSNTSLAKPPCCLQVAVLQPLQNTPHRLHPDATSCTLLKQHAAVLLSGSSWTPSRRLPAAALCSNLQRPRLQLQLHMAGRVVMRWISGASATCCRPAWSCRVPPCPAAMPHTWPTRSVRRCTQTPRRRPATPCHPPCSLARAAAAEQGCEG